MIVWGEFVTVEPMPTRAASPGVKGVSGAACPKAAHKACRGSPKRPASKALSKASHAEPVAASGEAPVGRKAGGKGVRAKVKAVGAAAAAPKVASNTSLFLRLLIHACVG